jgi:hypothetical protein
MATLEDYPAEAPMTCPYCGAPRKRPIMGPGAPEGGARYACGVGMRIEEGVVTWWERPSDCYEREIAALKKNAIPGRCGECAHRGRSVFVNMGHLCWCKQINQHEEHTHYCGHWKSREARDE